MLSEFQAKSQSDLLGLVLAVSEIHNHTSCVLPILIDEKIHHSIMKTIYVVSYQEYNVGHKLCRTPPAYGMWHPYKYTLTVTYRLFSHSW